MKRRERGRVEGGTSQSDDKRLCEIWECGGPETWESCRKRRWILRGKGGRIQGTWERFSRLPTFDKDVTGWVGEGDLKGSCLSVSLGREDDQSRVEYTVDESLRKDGEAKLPRVCGEVGEGDRVKEVLRVRSSKDP